LLSLLIDRARSKEQTKVTKQGEVLVSPKPKALILALWQFDAPPTSRRCRSSFRHPPRAPCNSTDQRRLSDVRRALQYAQPIVAGRQLSTW
jgi:hypothetical protein